jgi:ABC-type branched-subunit amino acid transport system ATPase component/branched-subunit amino acid ABC-type transport system permease component
LTKLLDLILSGAVTGGIYSIMAAGLVLTYTTSGIFNFAHAAIAFSAAYLYYQLNTGLGVPIVPSVIIVVFIFTPLLGLLLDRMLLRRLARAPVYARIVGTIGLLVALPNLMQFLVVTVGNDVLGLGLAGNQATSSGLSVPGVGPTPPHQFHPLHGVGLSTDQLAVFAVAGVAALGLWLVLQHTRAGLEMRAVVDRDTLAGLRGVNAGRTSAIAWVLTMLLAGIGGVLVAPLFALDSDTFTLVVLGSLAAVVLGGLRSLPIAFIGGVLLGIVQDLVAGYSHTLFPKSIANLTGLQSSIPYLLVVILGLVVGRDRVRRAGSVAEDAPSPDHRAGLPPWRRRAPWIVFTVALLAFSLHWFHVHSLGASAYYETVIAQSIAFGIVLLSFVVVTGLGGMVSLAQATFVTAGGLAAGWALAHHWGVNIPFIASHGQINFIWVLLGGTVVAGALGALIALPATRLGAVYLAIWTLSIALFFSVLIFALPSIGHGQLGWTVRSPTIDFAPLNWLNGLLLHPTWPWNVRASKLDFSNVLDQILLFLAMFGLVTALIHKLHRSASGRAMLAVRSSEIAAASFGIRVNRTKIYIFALGAAIAGFGGILLSVYTLSASNSTAPPQAGLLWLALAVLFGIRRPGGALLAGFAYAAGTAIFHSLVSVLPGGSVNTLVTSAYFVPILSGLGAVQLAMEPDGILAFNGNKKLAKRRAKANRARAEAVTGVGQVPTAGGLEPAVPAATARAVGLDKSDGRRSDSVLPSKRSPDTTLAIEGVVAAYGDAEVLHGVTVLLPAGAVTALLGANGAGKSTLCSVAAGLLAPSHGRVTLAGDDITLLAPYQRSRLGVQLVPEARGIFPGLTVEENLLLQVRSSRLRDQAYDRFPVLAERRRNLAGVLSGGEQQMLSLASAIVQPPLVLIADEPTLGLAPLAAQAVVGAITELRDAGTAVLLVEEHAQNALAVADTISFMELGRIVWSGPTRTADVGALSAAYLGAVAAG